MATLIQLRDLWDRLFNRSTNDSLTGSRNDIVAGDHNIINATNSSASGGYNQIIPIPDRGLAPTEAVADGWNNSLFSERTGARGVNNFVDGLIAQALGNSNTASGNDSLSAGGLCVTGRRVYTVNSHGADSLHGLGGGDKGFVIIHVSEEDVTNLFPSVLVPDGSGELRFGLHPYLLFQTGESSSVMYKILKSEYSSVTGTKIWYDNATDIAPAYVYSSFAPQLPVGYEGGNSMIAIGKNCNAVGNGSFATGQYTKAWGQQSFAEGYNTKATASYSHSAGIDSHASLAGQYAQGCSNGKFNNVGDAQFTRQILKKIADGVGWHDLVLLTTKYNRSYCCETQLIGRQYGGSVGKIGESAAYKFKWMVSRGSKKIFSPSDVNVTDNTITVSEHIPTNTKLLFSTTGTVPGGLDYSSLFYAIYVDETHIMLSATFGGSSIDLTSQGSGVHDYSIFDFQCMTKELIGRTFVADGDAIGDGLTTGIRADLYPNLHENGYIHLRLDGLDNRNLLWVATNQITELEY